MTVMAARNAAHHANTYRPDIDGLRALAVVSVVLYHGFPEAMPGGFAGVDVFFVISGFLITGIILDDLLRGTFTFANFYARRIRRIFPALISVLAASLLAGAILLLPGEFRQLGTHAAAGSLFLSNVALLREINYFDTSAELKPLLHLWSLAVEEQYYLVWPVALLLTRNRLAWGLGACAGIALTSFLLNVGLVEHRPSATFYLPFTRFWELMLGSALAYGQRWGGRQRAAATVDSRATSNMWLDHVLSAVGATLLAVAFVEINAQRAFPGWWALLPTLGAAMIICAGPKAWVNRVLLSHRWVVLVGLISYPLYLWHWPLLAFARIALGQLTPASVTVLIALAFFLAWLTYRYVETRIRLGRNQGHSRRVVRVALLSMCVVALCGVLIAKSVLASLDATSPLVQDIEAAAKDWMSIDEKIFPGSDRKVVFFGDSHMQQYGPRVVAEMADPSRPHKTAEFITRGGCAPIPGLERRGQGCAAFVRRGYERASMADVDTVVLAASWYGFTTRDDYRREGQDGGPALDLRGPGNQWVMDGFEAALRSLVLKGKEVVIVLSSPRGDQLRPQAWVERTVIGKRAHQADPLLLSDLRNLVSPVDDQIKAIASRIGATVVEPASLLCASECPALDEAGKFIYIDDSHLRASFVRRRIEFLDRFLYVDSSTERTGGRAKAGALTAMPIAEQTRRKEKS